MKTNYVDRSRALFSLYKAHDITVAHRVDDGVRQAGRVLVVENQVDLGSIMLTLYVRATPP